MSADPVSSDERAFILEYLTKNHGDETLRSVHAVMEHLPKKLAFFNSKPARRLLAVTNYRIFFFSGGKKSLSNEKPRDFHLYDVADIELEGNILILRTRVNKSPKLSSSLVGSSSASSSPANPASPQITSPTLSSPVMSAPEEMNVIRFQPPAGVWPVVVSDVQNSYQLINYLFPPDVACVVKVGSDLPCEEPPAWDKKSGFFAVYRAQSNYFKTPLNSEFLHHMESLFARNITDLDLSDVIGIEAKSEDAINLWPLFAALRYDQYFLSIILRKTARKEAAHLIADVLRTNSTLTRIWIENTGSDEKSFVELCWSLKLNTKNRIQVIQISDAGFGSKAAVHLGDAIESFNHGLRVLDLSNCSVPTKGLQLMFTHLTKNFGVSLTIEHLNIGQGNSFDKEGTCAMDNLFGAMKSHSKLRDLRLANSELQINFAPNIRELINITQLDLSGTKIDGGVGCVGVAYICEQSKILEKIVLSNCGLVKESLEPIHEAILGNISLNRIKYSLANNELGVKGLSYLASTFQKCNNMNRFSSIDLTGVKGKEEHLPELLESLARVKGITRVVLNRMLSKLSAKEVINPGCIAKFVLETPSLQFLEVANGFGRHYIIPLLQSLGNNNHLKSLNISGNALGDKGYEEVGTFLRTNSSVYDLNLDDNRITLTGLVALRNSIVNNKTVCRLPAIIVDFEKVLASETTLEKKITATRLLTEIQIHTDKNASENSSWGQVKESLEEFNDKEITTPTDLEPLPPVPEDVNLALIRSPSQTSEEPQQKSSVYMP